MREPSRQTVGGAAQSSPGCSTRVNPGHVPPTVLWLSSHLMAEPDAVLERLGARAVWRYGRREGGATSIFLSGEGQPSQVLHRPVSSWGSPPLVTPQPVAALCEVMQRYQQWSHVPWGPPYMPQEGRSLLGIAGLSLSTPEWRERDWVCPPSHGHRSMSDPSRSEGGVREVGFEHLSREDSLGKQWILAPILYYTTLSWAPNAPTGSGAPHPHPDLQIHASVPVLSTGVSQGAWCAGPCQPSPGLRTPRSHRATLKALREENLTTLNLSSAPSTSLVTFISFFF